MSIQKNRVPCVRIASIAFLLAFAFLWAGAQVHAGEVGVGFASAATEVSIDLTNSYEDLVSLTITAPKKGYVVLTGSGYLTLTTLSTLSGTVWGQATISIGTISGGSNTENETAVEIPFAEQGGHLYRYPFSITTVIPVDRGSNNFYMVGIRDPNLDYSIWSATSLKLTAIFVRDRID